MKDNLIKEEQILRQGNLEAYMMPIPLIKGIYQKIWGG